MGARRQSAVIPTEAAAAGAGSGDLLAANNLSDVSDAPTAAENLGVGATDSPQFAAIQLGDAADTTLTRSAAGILAVEGVAQVNLSAAQTLTNKTHTAPIIGGHAALLENAGILMDPVLSADGKYTMVRGIAGTAGATLVFGDWVYLAAADSRWELTDADAAATAGGVLVGVCVLAAAADGDPTIVMFEGNIRADSVFPTFTVSAPVYLSTDVGDVQVAAPSGTDDVIRIVGHGLTADSMIVNVSNEWTTHT